MLSIFGPTQLAFSILPLHYEDCLGNQCTVRFWSIYLEHLSVEDISGAYFWKIYLEPQHLSVASICGIYLEYISRASIWNIYLEHLFGTYIWRFYLEHISGASIWNIYMEHNISGTYIPGAYI